MFFQGLRKKEIAQKKIHVSADPEQDLHVILLLQTQ